MTLSLCPTGQTEGLTLNKSHRFIFMNWFDGRDSTRQLPGECIADCSGSGDATENVEFWVQHLNFDGPKDLFKEHLQEYGAWTDEQLEDHEENKLKVLWLWACDCSEQPGSYDYLHLGI